MPQVTWRPAMTMSSSGAKTCLTMPFGQLKAELSRRSARNTIGQGLSMENNRNFFITIALSVLILALWQYFYVMPRSEAQREAARIEEQRVAEQKKAAEAAKPGDAAARAPGATAPGAIPNAPGGDVSAAASREQALAATSASRSIRRACRARSTSPARRLDDLKLKHYTETVDKTSPQIQLLNPQALPTGYYAEIGFVGNDSDRHGAGSGHRLDRRRQCDADAGDAGDADLHQRQGPDLQAHDFRRRRLHVHRFRHRAEFGRGLRHPVELRPRHPLRQAARRQHLCAA